MSTVFAFLMGSGAGLWLGIEMQRRVRAERNLARLQRDVANQDRDQALTNNVRVLDPKRLFEAVQAHPAGTRVPKQDQR